VGRADKRRVNPAGDEKNDNIFHACRMSMRPASGKLNFGENRGWTRMDTDGPEARSLSPGGRVFQWVGFGD
jgi:hypothetical protein